jgi:hypothetical protein
MKKLFLRSLAALSTVLVLSCGGGGSSEGGGAASFDGAKRADTIGATGSGNGATSPDWGFASQSNFGDGNGDGGGGGGGSGSGSAGAGSSAGTGGDTTSASAGNSGVGSGGTGASASAGDSGDSGVGGVGGVASIFVNGVRYDTTGAVLKLRDAPVLQLGMTAKVNGPTNADFTAGVATVVESAADVRGAITAIDPAGGNMVVLGTSISTDNVTVWGNVSGLGALAPGMTVQVWGLPAGPGMLRATRVEQHAPSAPILSGSVQNLDLSNLRLQIGALTIDVRQAALPAQLATGTNIRVRAVVQPASGVLQAASVELWYPVSLGDGTRRQLGGVVTDFGGIHSFRVLGTPVNASSAQVSGGALATIGNGVELDVAGTVSNGVLVATKVRIRKTPGGASAASFIAIGKIGAFNSAADFKVKGQRIDASAPGVQFVGGSAANLGNGTEVSVTGEHIVNDALIATRVTFD